MKSWAQRYFDFSARVGEFTLATLCLALSIGLGITVLLGILAVFTYWQW